MTRFTPSLILLASILVWTNAFTPSAPNNAAAAAPFFANFVEKEATVAAGNENVLQNEVASDSSVMKKAASENNLPKKAAGGHGKGGILAPFVVLSKKVLGDDELNQLRGKVISLHSKVIGEFVDTANTYLGDRVLRALFELSDTNKNGTIEEEELATALKTLGFDLKDKQIKGIFERADLDADGAIDLEEWKKTAPSTLRTNLIKLAKKNGGDLGFLA
jgi:hypothetical protein